MLHDLIVAILMGLFFGGLSGAIVGLAFKLVASRILSEYVDYKPQVYNLTFHHKDSALSSEALEEIKKDRIDA